VKYNSRAIRDADWSHIRDQLLSDGWYFRNLVPLHTGELDTTELDTTDKFWSIHGEPDIRGGVIYVRRLFNG
jgi:hypothetical protein